MLHMIFLRKEILYFIPNELNISYLTSITGRKDLQYQLQQGIGHLWCS